MLSGFLDQWREIGELPRRHLYLGDSVTAHFFTKDEEVEALSIALTIDNASLQGSQWGVEIARLINLHIPFIKVKSSQVSAGKVFAQPESGIDTCTLSYRCVAKVREMAITHEIDSFFIYPKCHKDYQQGSYVYQPKTGAYYRCNGWPYLEYCRQGAKQFEPGVGESWQLAWQQCDLPQKSRAKRLL